MATGDAVDSHLEPYLAVVDRVSTLARAASGSQLDTTIPACPAWTARQVVAHLAGLAQDWVAGRLDPYGSDAWAQAQVDRFEGHPLDEVLEAWVASARRFSEIGPSPRGGTPAMWGFGDGVVHEADLRPVLAPGTRPPADAIELGLKAAIARWRDALAEAEVPPLRLVAGDLRSWPIGDLGAAGDEPVATVTTSAYEVFRALFGRRSRAQVEGWDWSVDPTPYLDAGLPTPFRWASAPLDD